MILLYSDSTDSRLTTGARLYNDEHAPRSYQFTGHFLELDGSDVVAAYDIDDICRIPGYRLATAQEMNQWAAAKRKAARLEEAAAAAAPAAPEVVPDAAPAQPEAAQPQTEDAPAPSDGQVLTTDAAPQAAGKDKK